MDGIYILKAFTSWYSIGLNHMSGSDSGKSDSDSSKLSDLFEDASENENIGKSKQLWIDRSTCQITESRIPLTDEEPISEIPVDAFLGIVEVLNTYHLGVVTRSEVVAELNLEEISFNINKFSSISMIKEVKFFPLQSTPEEVYTVTNPNPADIIGSINYTTLGNLSNLTNIASTINSSLLMSSQEQVQLQTDVQKIIDNMEKILTTGYYYSYDTDITNSLQNLYMNNSVPLENLLKLEESSELKKERELNMQDKRNKQGKGEGMDKRKEELMNRNKVLNKISNRDFNWCYKSGLNMPKKWMTVMIQGYVGYTVSYVGQDRIELLLIGRRNIKRCGTRFVARGIDEEGNVGNFVETEMRIRINHSKWYSFIQNRGSVPVFWEQTNFTSPVNLFNFHLNYRSFSKHVDVLKEFYKPCQYFLFVNLLDVKESEKMLSESYLEVVDEYNSNSSSSCSSDRDARSEDTNKEEDNQNIDKIEKGSMTHEEYEKMGAKPKQPKETETGQGYAGYEHGKRYCEKIELVNYNYNVNAKWSTHEIIINYILDNLSVQLENVGYFDAKFYEENVKKYGSKSVCQRKRRNSKTDELFLIDDLLDFRTKEFDKDNTPTETEIEKDKDKEDRRERLEKEQKEQEIMKTYRQDSKKKDKEHKEKLEREQQEKYKEKRILEGLDKEIEGEEDEYSKYHGSVYDDLLGDNEKRRERRGSKEVGQVVGIKEDKDVKLISYKNVEKINNDNDKKLFKDKEIDELFKKEIIEYELEGRDKKEKVEQKETEIEQGYAPQIKEIDNGLQKGIIRTNCLDCLDRTNIFQWMIGWVVFNKVLSENNGYGYDEDEKKQVLKQMLLGKETGMGVDNVLFNSFTELWCNHGDYISLHYSGTASTLSERVKKQSTSLNSILQYSKIMVQRYYSSLFQDSQRQTVFNILSPYPTPGSSSSGGNFYRKQGEELLLIEHEEQEKDKEGIDEGERRKLSSSKYYIEDPFMGEGKEEIEKLKEENMTKKEEYKDKTESEIKTQEEYEKMGAKPKETDSIFDKLNNEIVNKLMLLSKSSILPTTPETSLDKEIIEYELEGRDKKEKVEQKETGSEQGYASQIKEIDELFKKEIIGEDLKLWIGTWNIGAHSVQINDDMLSWIEIKKIECDFYVFNFQEFLELNFINIATGRRDENKEYEFEHLIYNLFRFSTVEKYEKLGSISMTGLYLVIFVKKSLKPHVKDLMITNVKTGMNYNIGNKGCVAIRFKLFNREFSFLNLHLNFGKNLNVGRIELMEYILRNSFKEYNKNVTDDSLFVLGGDFNFQVELEKEVVFSLLKKMEYEKLFNYDEFNMARMIGIPILGKLYESKINFQPTYKYKDGTKYYTTKRAPAWCDRIIIGGSLFDTNKVKVLTYKRNDNLIVSDHRPVSSIIMADISK